MNKISNVHQRFLDGVHGICGTQKVPSSWKTYNTLLLFKKPKDYNPGEEEILKKFRPIAPSNVGYKVFASMLGTRLIKWLQLNNGVQWSQRAIFNHNGVRDNTLVNAAIQTNQKVVFFDLSDAFNSVNHELLIEGLSKIGAQIGLSKLFESYIFNALLLLFLCKSNNSPAQSSSTAESSKGTQCHQHFLIFISAPY